MAQIATDIVFLLPCKTSLMPFVWMVSEVIRTTLPVMLKSGVVRGEPLRITKSASGLSDQSSALQLGIIGENV